MSSTDKCDCAVFAEVSMGIGTGHLRECVNIIDSAKRHGIRFKLFVSSDSPKNVLNALRLEYMLFDMRKLRQYPDRVSAGLVDAGCKAAVFNFRRIEESVIGGFKRKGITVISIDEFGGCSTKSDIVINSSIVSKFHKYRLTSGTMLFKGPEYLPMRAGFASYHERRKRFPSRISDIAISMGGVDRTGATVRIIDALSEIGDKINKRVILGAGFPFMREVRERKRLLDARNFTILTDVKKIEREFFRSDVVFNAGGNTLYELACLGVPSVTFYEDPHERENAMAFARAGFGLCAGVGLKADSAKVARALKHYEDPKIRAHHSTVGRTLVDGLGALRIAELICQAVKPEGCVTV